MRLSLLALLLVLGTARAQETQQIKLRDDLNEEVIMLQVEGRSTRLETTLFKPKGKGPFPLVLINHGKASGNPYFQPRARYTSASEIFVKWGYLVALPNRQGFSKSSGGYVEPGCNITSNGLMQAEDLRYALDALTKRPDVDATNIVVVGQSHGGLTTMAFGTFNYPGVKGLINFAGGLAFGKTGPMSTCQWEVSMISALKAYAGKTSIPSIWFYGDNDSYWGPELPIRLHQEYSKISNTAQLVAYGVFAPGDAHGMFSHRRGRDIWVKPVAEFMRKAGLPLPAESQRAGRPPADPVKPESAMSDR